jgi:hypothetical protein
VAAGTLLRALSLGSDFWLDEIWTWHNAVRLRSALGVFTELHHSNNHHLNTLLFYALGDQRCWAIYRLPSLVAGSATIALAAALAARRGQLEAVLAAGLCAASFPLVYYSSEARGYAPAVCFALGALLALLRFLERGGAAWAALFAAATCLGLLSQLVFAFFWAGALALTATRLARRPGPRLADALRLHAAPALVLLLLYGVDLRHLRVGGGPPTVASEVAARTVGYSLGLPVRPELAPAHAALALGLLALALIRLRRERDDLWLLHLIAIALAPAAVLSATRPEVVDLRYFLIGIALFLILLAQLLADALRAGGWRRAAALIGLAVFFAGNGVHAARFLERGRGGFQAALRYMAEHGAGPEIVVGSDQDFRNGIVLRFYARLLPPGRRLDYRERGSWPEGGPEWIVVHRRERPRRPLPELSFEAARYRLAAEFDHAAISGFYWGVYQRLGTAGGPTSPGASGSRDRSRRGRRARARSAPRARRRPRSIRRGGRRCAGRGRRVRPRTRARRGARGRRNPAGRSAGRRASPPRRRPRSRSEGRGGNGSDSFAGASS